MPLQTWIQLQILLYATPALVGWALMPLAQMQLACTAIIVSHTTVAETVVAPEQRYARPVPACQRPMASRRFIASETDSAAPLRQNFPNFAAVLLADISPLPYAPRAP